MKHGPIALIDATLPVVVLATRGRDREKTFNQLEQVRARGGRVLWSPTKGIRRRDASPRTGSRSP